MAPNWHTTASNSPSENGNAIASACRHSTARGVPMAAASSSIARFKSVATMETLSLSPLANARVATPVPAAISSTRETLEWFLARTRSARSAAYGSKISGTKYLSYNFGIDPAKTLSASVMPNLQRPILCPRTADDLGSAVFTRRGWRPSGQMRIMPS